MLLLLRRENVFQKFVFISAGLNYALSSLMLRSENSLSGDVCFSGKQNQSFCNKNLNFCETNPQLKA